jgi:hypothetical protein
MSSNTDFKYILNAILGQKDDSPLSVAFKNGGILDPIDIISCSDADINDLKWTDPTFIAVKNGPPAIEALNNGLKQLVRAFKAFVDTKNIEGNPIHGDWQNLAKKADFDAFRLNDYNTYSSKVPVPRTLQSPADPSSGNAPWTRNPVLEFKKGIKRDPANFVVLKDNKQWDSVHRTLKAQVNYQDVADVINPNYVPATTKTLNCSLKSRSTCTRSSNVSSRQMKGRSSFVAMMVIAMRR